MHTNTPCFSCKYYIGKYKCKAFDDIPKDILLAKNDHKKPYPGDSGIRYSPIVEKKDNDR